MTATSDGPLHAIADAFGRYTAVELNRHHGFALVEVRRVRRREAGVELEPGDRLLVPAGELGRPTRVARPPGRP